LREFHRFVTRIFALQCWYAQEFTAPSFIAGQLAAEYYSILLILAAAYDDAAR